MDSDKKKPNDDRPDTGSQEKPTAFDIEKVSETPIDLKVQCTTPNTSPRAKYSIFSIDKGSARGSEIKI